METELELSKDPYFYIRVESRQYGYYAFYTVQAPNKSDAGVLARKQFAKDFGGTFEGCFVGYTWDSTTLIDFKTGMKIDKEIQESPLYD